MKIEKWEIEIFRTKAQGETLKENVDPWNIYNITITLQMNAVLYLIFVDQLPIPLLNLVPRLADELVSSNTKNQSSKNNGAWNERWKPISHE